ncbi:Non-specific serine/threonine protein kinase [Bertholletia excelsa]
MNGNSLAIKRFRQDSHHLDHHFMIEIMAIGRVRHRNIVTLLGFCIEREERLLVYSYMPNGSLYKWLHPMHSHSSALDWPLRLHIAKEIAKGLAWLHHHGQYGVTHGRISSKCILLDKHFNPKISNFGRATLVKSYYYKYMMSSHKKDIYGLGLLLLEMVTGKNPDELQKMSESFNGNLVEWITLFLNTGNFYEIVDKSLIGQGFDVQIIQLLKVASWCIRPALKERATILQVTSNLSIIGVGNGSAYHLNVEEDVDGEIEIVEVGF